MSAVCCAYALHGCTSRVASLVPFAAAGIWGDNSAAGGLHIAPMLCLNLVCASNVQASYLWRDTLCAPLEAADFARQVPYMRVSLLQVWRVQLSWASC